VYIRKNSFAIYDPKDNDIPTIGLAMKAEACAGVQEKHHQPRHILNRPFFSCCSIRFLLDYRRLPASRCISSGILDIEGV